MLISSFSMLGTSLVFSSINVAKTATISSGFNSRKKLLVIISVNIISLHSEIFEAIIPFRSNFILSVGIVFF